MLTSLAFLPGIAAAFLAPALQAPERLGLPWESVPLPVEAGAPVDVELSRIGCLYVATEEDVFLRSPFGEAGGWRRVDGPGSAGAPARAIKDLATLDGPVDEALCIVYGDELRLVSSAWSEEEAHPWDVFRLTFSGVSLRAPEGMAFERVHALGESADGRVRGWVETSSGGLAALVVDSDGWALGSVSLAPGSGAGWSVVDQRDAEGAFGWERGGALLHWLGDSGDTVALADLGAQFPTTAGGETAEIHAAFLDLERDLVFVGTSLGLLVGDWVLGGAQGPMLGPMLGPIELVEVGALKGAGVVALGTTAGRLRLTVANPAPLGLSSAVLWEASLRAAASDAASAAGMEFFPGADGGPGAVKVAFALADDLLLVEATDGLWEWAPGRWKRIEGLVEPAGPDPVRTHDVAPPVFLDREGRRALHRAPSPPSGWHVHDSAQPASIERLLPDASRRGVWSYASGSWCFETPHGSLLGAGQASTSSAGSSGRLRVKEWALELPGTVFWIGAEIMPSDGDQRLPKCALGGLMVPAGDHFVHLDAGVVTEVPWRLPGGGVLRDAMPATEFDVTGWLAIHDDGQSSRVVHVDVGQSEEGALEMVVDGVSVSITPEALFYDSAGEIWCGGATRSVDGAKAQWSGVPVKVDSWLEGDARSLGPLPAGGQPRMLWLAPDEPMSTVDDLLFTDLGVLPVRRADSSLFGQSNKPRSWIELFAPGGGRRFHGVRLPAQLFASWGFNRRLLILTESAPEGQAPRADRAFVLSVDEPAKPLVAVELELAIDSEDLTVPLWWAGSSGSTDRFLLPRDDARGRTSAMHVRRRTEPLSASSTYQESVAPLDRWACAVRVAGDYGGGPDSVDLAGSDGALVAVRVDAASTYLDTTHLAAEVTYSGGGKETSLRVPDRRLSEVIASDFTELRLRVEPAQWAWWIPAPGLAYATLNEERVEFDASGTAAFPLDHDKTYEIGVANDSLSSGESMGLRSWTARTAPAPPPPATREVVAITLASLGAAFLVLLGVVRPLRRATLAMLRRRHWAPVASTPDLEVTWNAGSAEADNTWRSRAFHDPKWRDGEGGGGWRARVMETRVPDGGSRPTTAVVEFADGQAHRIWSANSVLRDDAGTLRGMVGFQPTVVRPPQRPHLRKGLSAIVLAGDASEEAARGWRGRIARCGVRARATVKPEAAKEPAQAPAQAPAEAMAEALVEALSTADLAVLLREPGALPKGLGGSLRKRDVRGRLLVMVGQGAAPTDDARRWILALAELGVHVLWLPSVTGLDGFREGFLGALLHGGWSGGATVAESIAAGLSLVDNAAAPAIEGSLLLVGNPELRFAPVKRHFAFLSHSSQDEAQVRWLRGRLRGLLPLPMHRRRICVDQESFAAGPLRRTVADNLAGSDWLVVCNTPGCAASVWVERELKQFLADRPGDRMRFCDLVPTENVDAAFLEQARRRSGEEELIRPNVSSYPDAKAKAAVEVLRRELRRQS